MPDQPLYRAAVIIALHTGMRREEQFSLGWEQVNMATRDIHLTRTKNGSDRHIPITPFAGQRFNA